MRAPGGGTGWAARTGAEGAAGQGAVRGGLGGFHAVRVWELLFALPRLQRAASEMFCGSQR